MPVIKEANVEALKKELEKKFLVFDARNALLPVKQYFLPAQEETFIFDRAKKKISVSRPGKKSSLIFGLNLRDTEALIQLDEIMRKPQPDFFYFQKRDSVTIISIIDEDGPLPHLGVDLLLEKISPDEYKTHILTEKGKKISQSKFFEEIAEVRPKSVEQPENKVMSELRKLLLDAELLKDAVEWSWNGYPEMWEKLAKQCLGCGICTYVCPLCYCFSIEDRCLLDNKTCTKSRKWTSCVLPEFSRISGGRSFHPTLKERYYNWFFHKFVRGYKEYGKSQCVACGRCQKYCPAGVDIEQILLELTDEFKKAKNGN